MMEKYQIVLTKEQLEILKKLVEENNQPDLLKTLEEGFLLDPEEE